MKIRILFFALFLSITTLSFGQQYYVGASIGWHQDIFTMSETHKYISTKYIGIINPSANLGFNIGFNNGLELSLGCGYYNYMLTPTMFLLAPNGKINPIRTALCSIYQAISIPIAIGYNINLWNKRFLLKIQSGLDFDICFLESGGLNGYDSLSDGQQIRRNITFESPVITHFNILLSNRISLQYFTKFGMGISIFGAYHAGLMPIWQTAYGHFDWNNGTEILDTKFLSNGSYWQFGIELGYRFGGKKKESTH
jgi:hypothetical protein